jgi:hypothetical protein
LLVAGIVGVAAALAGFGGWLAGGDPGAGSGAGAAGPAAPLVSGRRRGEKAAARRPPRFVASDPGSTERGEEGRPMPKGLAHDLARFNDVQLRAELESLVLSFPEVQVVEASCPALPCRAEVASADATALARFADAVRRRFQGFLRTEIGPDPAAPPRQRARFLIGTSHVSTSR